MASARSIKATAASRITDEIGQRMAAARQGNRIVLSELHGEDGRGPAPSAFNSSELPAQPLNLDQKRHAAAKA